MSKIFTFLFKFLKRFLEIGELFFFVRKPIDVQFIITSISLNFILDIFLKVCHLAPIFFANFFESEDLQTIVSILFFLSALEKYEATALPAPPGPKSNIFLYLTLPNLFSNDLSAASPSVLVPNN